MKLHARPSLILLLVLGMMAWTCNAHGQRAEESAVEAQAGDAIARYNRRIEQYKTSIASQPARIDAYLNLSRLYRILGRLDEAETQARKAAARDSTSAGAQRAIGEILLAQGRYEEAEEVLERAASRPTATLALRLRLGLLYKETGRNARAHESFAGLVRAYQRGAAVRAEDLTAVALAFKYLERFHEANDLFAQATRLDPTYIDAYVAWGYLFLEKYNRREAAGIFQDALRIDAGYPPALTGLADVQSETQATLAETGARHALSINPRLIEAHQLLARLELVDEQYDAALEHLRTALGVNPASPATHTLLAACYQAMGDEDEYEAECRRVLHVNPHYGQLYATLADNLSRRYRFHEAIGMGRKAIALDPELWNAYASLGINLSRVGMEKEARRYLDSAFEHDSFNTRTYNTLNLFDSFKDYTRRASAHFVLKLPADEDPVYGRQALALLEEAYRTLSPRYHFTTDKPILVEMFPKHEDFGVRISGLPGAGALLGVCFGEVIVADSPKARPAGSFNWGQTLWHEFAHVIHLQLTRNRVPRWLAEGIAVYEARVARPEWGLDMDPEFASAVEKGELLEVSELNSGFTRPKSAEQVILSYYQASIVVEYIVGKYGFDVVLDMLRLFGEDRNTAEVLQAALGVSCDDFDEAFRAYAREKTKAARKALRFAHGRKRELSESDLRDAIEENPDSFYAHLFLGRLLLGSEEEEEAIAELNRACDLLPGYVHADSPYRLLAGVYRKRGDEDALIRELEALASIDEDDIEACKELGRLYEKRHRDTDEIRVLSRAVMINPFDANVRNMRAAAYERQQRFDAALADYQAALAVETTDPAQAHYNLARVFLAADKKEEAKGEAFKALEIAPNYEAAQQVLLKAVDKPGTHSARSPERP